MVAGFQDMTISYSVISKKKEAADPKQTHLPQDAKGPTYKAKEIRVVKRMQRRGKGLIKSIVEEEYKENKEDGTLSYLES